MADPVSLSLPSLSPNNLVRYKGIPRRYEETRPVFIQGNAHRKILGLGHDLEKRVHEKYEAEKQRAIREAEQAVWEQAEQMKAAAVLKAKEESSIDLERVVKKINRQHEKALKEEALKVEMAMQKLAIEQVKQERAEAEERLKEAVRKTEVRCHQELVEAVEKARDEERKIAAAEAVKVATVKAAQEKFEKAIQVAAEEKKKALKELEDRKNKEREKAVTEMEVAQKKIAADQLEKLKKEYEQINARLKEEIKAKLDIIDSLNLQITCIEKAKKNVEDVLHDTKTDFQDFIDRLPESIKGQVGYMVRPIYIDEIGRVATII